MRAILAAILLCPMAASASSFERFDLPGATDTCGTAIASDGLVAGLASDGTTASSKPFLYRSGHFSFPPLSLPAGTALFNGVNRWRGIAGGLFQTSPIGSLPFVHTPSGTSIPFLTDGPVLNVTGLSDSGTLLGQVATIDSFPSGSHRPGFLKTATGAVTLLDDGTGDTQPLALDGPADYVVGQSLSAAGLTGWVYHQGTFSPVAVPGALWTTPHGVDRAGNVSGTYITGSIDAPVLHGFRLRGGTYTSWEVAGATRTQIQGMNDRGQVTGCYMKAGRVHGFIATP